MSRDLCARCYELLPDVGLGEEGECPHCGLGFSAGRTPLRRAGLAKKLTDAELVRWRRQMAEDSLATVTKLATFNPYGLDESWVGIRWLGGWGSNQSRRRGLRRGVTTLTQIELAHGERLVYGAPTVDISTVVSDGGGWQIHAQAELCLSGMWHDEGEDLDVIQQTMRGSDPFEPWARVALCVAAVECEFRLLHVGKQWLALGSVEGFVLSVVGRHVDPSACRLVEVDLDDYRDLPVQPHKS